MSILLNSNKNIDFNKSYYENQLEFDDWHLIFESGNAQSLVQHYQKGSQLLQITIKMLNGIDKNRTQILLHLVR